MVVEESSEAESESVAVKEGEAETESAAVKEAEAAAVSAAIGLPPFAFEFAFEIGADVRLGPFKLNKRLLKYSYE